MAQHQTGDKELSKPVMDQFYLTDACVSPFACDQSGIATLPRLSECTCEAVDCLVAAWSLAKEI